MGDEICGWCAKLGEKCPQCAGVRLDGNMCSCLKALKEFGKSRCRACLDARNEKQREASRLSMQRTRAVAREQGLCIVCTNSPARTGSSSCEACSISAVLRSKARYQKLKSQGRRTECSCPSPGRAVCTECSVKKGRFYSRPKRGHDYEKRKLERNKARAMARKEQGLCVRCGEKPHALNKQRCSGCLKKIAMTSRERDTGWTEEQYQEACQSQEGKCYLCGVTPKRPVADHCHTSGTRRHLLCDPCNARLGWYERFRTGIEAYVR